MSDDGATPQDGSDPAPPAVPWGPPAGIVFGLVLFFILKDVSLVWRIGIAFAAIAVMTWLSLVAARRRQR